MKNIVNLYFSMYTIIIINVMKGCKKYGISFNDVLENAKIIFKTEENK